MERAVLSILCISIVLLLPACQKKPLTAELETSEGTMIVELYPDDAPKTVENFVGLAKQGYYDGLTFHRIAKGFVIQTGDSLGTGEGGRSIYGSEFEDELNPATSSYQTGYMRGVVAMANRGPNTNLSQFFVLLRDAPSLQKNYTIFGKVVKGMEVADLIAAVEIIPVMGPGDGKPKTDVVLKRVTILN